MGQLPSPLSAALRLGCWACGGVVMPVRWYFRWAAAAPRPRALAYSESAGACLEPRAPARPIHPRKAGTVPGSLGTEEWLRPALGASVGRMVSLLPRASLDSWGSWVRRHEEGLGGGCRWKVGSQGGVRRAAPPAPKLVPGGRRTGSKCGLCSPPPCRPALPPPPASTSSPGWLGGLCTLTWAVGRCLYCL